MSSLSIRRRLGVAVGLGAAIVTAGCSGSLYNSMGGTRDEVLSREEQAERARGSLFGEGGLVLSTGGRGQAGPGETGIGVNSFLWRASLDTVAFMPIASADPFGGVILTDWYSLPEAPNERFKVNIYILDRELRADGVRVAVFRQVRDRNGGWADAAVSPGTGSSLEDTILTRARELRVAQAAR